MWNLFFSSSETKHKNDIIDFFNCLNLKRDKIMDQKANLLLTPQVWNEIKLIETILTKGNQFHLLDVQVKRFLSTKLLPTSQIINCATKYLIHIISLPEDLKYSLYVTFNCVYAKDETNEMFYHIVREWIKADNQV